MRKMTCKSRHPMGLRHPVPITYGVATISRLLKIIGLFCKRALEKRPYSAKETYHFKEPTNRSHPITSSGLYRGESVCVYMYLCVCVQYMYVYKYIYVYKYKACAHTHVLFISPTLMKCYHHCHNTKRACTQTNRQIDTR